MWSASYVLAKTLEHKGSITSFSFYGQLVNSYSHIFNLIHPVDEFSFEETNMWSQPKILPYVFVIGVNQEK